MFSWPCHHPAFCIASIHRDKQGSPWQHFTSERMFILWSMTRNGQLRGKKLTQITNDNQLIDEVFPSINHLFKYQLSSSLLTLIWPEALRDLLGWAGCGISRFYISGSNSVLWQTNILLTIYGWSLTFPWFSPDPRLPVWPHRVTNWKVYIFVAKLWDMFDQKFDFMLSWDVSYHQNLILFVHKTRTKRGTRTNLYPIYIFFISDLAHDWVVAPVQTSSNIGDNVIMGCSPPEGHPAPTVRSVVQGLIRWQRVNGWCCRWLRNGELLDILSEPRYQIIGELFLHKIFNIGSGMT